MNRSKPALNSMRQVYTTTTDEHGSHYFSYPPTAPANWLSPDDYCYGQWNLRYEILDQPTSLSTTYQTCIWQDGIALESCSGYATRCAGQRASTGNGRRHVPPRGRLVPAAHRRSRLGLCRRARRYHAEGAEEQSPHGRLCRQPYGAEPVRRWRSSPHWALRWPAGAVTDAKASAEVLFISPKPWPAFTKVQMTVMNSGPSRMSRKGSNCFHRTAAAR